MTKRKTRGTTTTEARHENVRLVRHGGRPRSRERGLTGAQVARRACHELAEITRLRPAYVTSLARSDDDRWNVTVGLLELHRVPDTDDLIGSYEAELDESGELLAYQRVGRYSRRQTQAEQRDGDLNGDTFWEGEVER